MKGRFSSLTSMLIHASPLIVLALAIMCSPIPCFASLQTSVDNIKNMMTTIILPAASTCGIILAAVSFFTGSPRAKEHAVYAIIGCCIGYGSQMLIDFIRDAVR